MFLNFFFFLFSHSSTTQKESCFQDLSNGYLLFANENENEIEPCNNGELPNVEDGLNYDNEWYFRL